MARGKIYDTTSHADEVCVTYGEVVSQSPNIAVKCLTQLLRIPEILGSDLCPEIVYLDGVLREFPQSLQAKAGVI